MKGYPLRINSIDSVEDFQTIRCAVEQTLIANGQFFVESRPNSKEKIVPVFQLINGVRKKTTASLVVYKARMVILKNN